MIKKILNIVKLYKETGRRMHYYYFRSNVLVCIAIWKYYYTFYLPVGAISCRLGTHTDELQNKTCTETYQYYKIPN